MSTIRWGSFTIALITIVVAGRLGASVSAAILAGIFLAAFIVFCWTLGAFAELSLPSWALGVLRKLDPRRWATPIPDDHPDTIRSLAHHDRAERTHYQENHR